MATAPFMMNNGAPAAGHPANSPILAAESAVASAFLEVIPRNEFLVAGDPEWVNGLISAYNRCYAWGSKAMTILLVILLLVFAPFVGLFSAAWSFAGAIFRQGALLVGRATGDALGYRSYVMAKATYYSWKRSLIRPSLVAPCPPEGVKSSSREEVLRESELGFLPSPEELFYGRADAAFAAGGHNNGGCMTACIRYFNSAFSFGFLIGTILLAVLTILFSPFLGAFVSFFSFCYSLLRSFSRAEGRLILDIFGVGELVAQEVALMKEEMQLGGTTAAAAPTTNNITGGAAIPTASYVPPMTAPGTATVVVANPVNTAVLYPAIPVATATNTTTFTTYQS